MSWNKHCLVRKWTKKASEVFNFGVVGDYSVRGAFGLSKYTLLITKLIVVALTDIKAWDMFIV